MQKRLPGIDILRGGAALAVVVGHLHKWQIDACSGAPAALCGWLGRVCDAMGAWGVGLFFVLSGVCIHLPAARATARGDWAGLDLKSYAERRFWRIYPPHLGALVLSWSVAATLGTPPAFDPMISVPTGGQLAAHLVMIHSFIPSATYSINVVLWTIAIEAHFYVLYPLLLRLKQRFSLVSVTAALFALSLAVRLLAGLFKAHPVLNTLAGNFPGRWWEWSLGAVIAEVAVRAPATGARPADRRLSSAALGLLAIAGLLVTTGIEALPHGVLIGSVIEPFFAAAVVLGAMKLAADGRIGAIGRGTLWLGHRSYSLYLIHPIILTVGIAALTPLGGAPALARAAVVLVAAVLGSAAYFSLVERWFLAGRSPFAPTPPAAARPAAPTPGL